MACAIELEDKVIVTGGYDNQKSVSRVDVYNISGWMMELPHLIRARRQHGCGHYIDSDDRMVS